MLKKSKWINILCSMIFGVVLCAVVLLVLLLRADPNSLDPSLIVFRTDSSEKTYDGTPLTDIGWMIKGELQAGHQAVAEVSGSRTGVGESENVGTLRIENEYGEDVTSEYRIRNEFGTLRVKARRLTVTSASAFRVYDKNDQSPLTAPQYEVSEELLAGHTLSADVTGILEGVGMAANTVENVRIVDRDGNDVTENYNLKIREGILAITEKSQSSPLNPGEIFSGTSDLLPPEDLENTVMYSIYGSANDYVYLKVQSYGDYDGKGWGDAPLYADLLDGLYSPAYLTGSAMKAAGMKADTLRIKSFCNSYGLPTYLLAGSEEAQTDETFFSGNTEDIYEVLYYGAGSANASLSTPHTAYEEVYRNFAYQNYLTVDAESRAYMQALIEKEGFRTDDPDIVESVAKFIQSSAVYDKKYPQEMENESNVVIAFLETYKTGLCRHYASAAVLMYRTLGIPARYVVGALAEAKAGEWSDVKASSAHAWVEVYRDGIGWVQVEVTGSPDEDSQLVLSPETARYPYDGNTHEAPDILEGFEKLEKLGYTYQAVVSGSRSEAGVTETVIESVTVFNAAGVDVTSSFRIKTQTGILQVYYERFIFNSESETVTYGSFDSAPAVIGDPALAANGLTAVYERQLEITDVGVRLNRFGVTLLNAAGEDVTDCYWVDARYGQLTIEPLKLTLKAGDAEKVYDGEALTCDEIFLVEGALAEDHILAVYEIVGSQKTVGCTENEITLVTIHNENGYNVTHNYAITLLPGQLKVTLR